MKKKEGNCSIEGCTGVVRTRSLCNKHHVASLRSRETAVLSLTKENEIMKLKEALSAAEKENLPLRERIQELERKALEHEEETEELKEKLSDHEKRISTLEEEKSELIIDNRALTIAVNR